MTMNADELAKKVAHAMLAVEGTGPAWGIRIDEIRAGFARVSMVVRSDMLNGHRTVHGGMVFALADTAFAYACNGRNEKAVGAQAGIVFLGSAREGEMLIAEAEDHGLAARAEHQWLARPHQHFPEVQIDAEVAQHVLDVVAFAYTRAA